MDGAARNGKWVNVDYAAQRGGEDAANGLRVSGQNGMSSAHDATTTSVDGSEAYYIQITVNEPMKQGEGMNAYISYKISTATNRPQFTKSAFSVIRRYSDFVWLHANLSAMYPGVVVPPLPEKLLVGRFSPEFIESRRRALQLFLQRCSMHPELQHSEHLTTFLEASDELLTTFKSDPKNDVAKHARGSIFQWLDETVNTISSTLGAANTGSNLEKSAADVEVEEMMAYIDGLEPIMTGLHKHAHGLTKRAREIADGLFEFGVAYALLGKTEDNPSLQEALREVGQCSDRLSLLAAEHAEKEALHFEEPIMDYIRLVGAVKAALHKRNEVRCSYANAVADLETKSSLVQKLLKQKSSSEEKFQLAESDVMKAQQRVDDAKLEFDIVTERVMREVERFKREKMADFKRIILDFVQLQIEYSKKVEYEWNTIIPKLANIRVDSGVSSSLSSIASASSTSGGATSFIQEDYIPSTSSSRSHMNEAARGDLSHNLLSLSLDQEDEEETKSSNEARHSTRLTTIQVRSAGDGESYNPDITL